MKTYGNFFTIMTFFLLNLCVNPATNGYGDEITFSAQGIASYYADRFHGRKTASGERYDKNILTAAHRKLKFGTSVLVTNLANNKTVSVKINDRGPFIDDRVIDLSYAAARKIGLLKKGITSVRLDILR